MKLTDYFTLTQKPLFPRIETKDITAVKLGLLNETFNPLTTIPSTSLTHLLNTGVGIEIEVENAAPIVIPGWATDADNSLRDQGYEFKTIYGTRIFNVPHLLKVINNTFNSTLSRRSYSERCSVHVHLDIRRFDEEQLTNLLILYTLVEDALFLLAGEMRKNNIFCVPLRKSLNPNEGSIWNYINACHKYTAMNLTCARNFGTVEFRHMEGNDDPRRIFNWIILLGLIHRAAATLDGDELKFNVKRLKNDSQYEKLLKSVFYGFLQFLPWRGTDIDSAVSDSKLFFWEDQ